MRLQKIELMIFPYKSKNLKSFQTLEMKAKELKAQKS